MALRPSPRESQEVPSLTKLLELQALLAPVITEHAAQVKELVAENKQLRTRLTELGAVVDKNATTVMKQTTPRGSPLEVETVLNDGRRFIVDEPPEMQVSSSQLNDITMEATLQAVPPLGLNSIQDHDSSARAAPDRVGDANPANEPLLALPETPRSGGEDGELWVCKPVNGNPVAIRDDADFDAKLTGQVVLAGETFRVSELKANGKGTFFLRLADRRGWVFDAKPGVGSMCTKVESPTPQKAAGGGLGLPQEKWKCDTVNGQPLGIRKDASTEAAQSGSVLKPGEVFSVSEKRIQSAKEGGTVTFLKLADGRGWVFDRKPGIGTMCSRVLANSAQACTGDSNTAQNGQAGNRQDAETWKCSPFNGQPVGIRKQSKVDGEQTGHLLLPGETFSVAQVMMGDDFGTKDVRFLRLADGRGWVFDTKPGHGTMCTKVVEGSGQPAASAPAEAPVLWKCDPCNGAKVGIREGPAFEAKQTGGVLQPGDTFSVSETSPGADGVLFLKLADGRGWVFNGKPGVGTMCIKVSSAPAEVTDRARPSGQTKRIHGDMPPIQALELVPIHETPQLALEMETREGGRSSTRQNKLRRQIADCFPMARLFCRGISVSVNPLAWGACAIASLVYIFALLGVFLIKGGDDPHSEFDVAANKSFGSVSDSMLSLMALASGDGGFAIYRPLVTSKPWLGLYFGTFWLLVSVAVLNLVTAVIVNLTVHKTREDQDRQREADKAAKLSVIERFRSELCELEGEKERVSLRSLLEAPQEVQEHLQLLGESHASLLPLFHVLLQDGRDTVCVHELCDGLKRIENGVPIEMLELRKRTQDISMKLGDHDRLPRLEQLDKIAPLQLPPLDMSKEKHDDLGVVCI